jgi:hypothetical protein
VANSGDSFMKFIFLTPTNIYGMIIGNNIGVSGGWNSSYLEDVQIQVRTSHSAEYKTVHTIKGMPNVANTAYLAKIETQAVEEVRMWKGSYFSTSFIHFV